jgi:cytochrome b561
MKSAPVTHFAAGVRWLHGLMAGLIVAMLFIGIGMVSTVTHTRDVLLALHRPLGLAILLLALVRIAVRLTHRAPSLPASLPRWQRAAAHASHLLLYGLMLAMPLVGWAMLSAGGFPVVLGGGLRLFPIAPHSLALYGVLRSLHTALAFALFATFLLHLAAALMHAWVYRDGVFGSMWSRGGRASVTGGDVRGDAGPALDPSDGPSP